MGLSMDVLSRRDVKELRQGKKVEVIKTKPAKVQPDIPSTSKGFYLDSKISFNSRYVRDEKKTYSFNKRFFSFLF